METISRVLVGMLLGACLYAFLLILKPRWSAWLLKICLLILGYMFAFFAFMAALEALWEVAGPMAALILFAAIAFGFINCARKMDCQQKKVCEPADKNSETTNE